MAKHFVQYFEDSFKENWELPAMTNYTTKQTLAYKDVAREVAKLHILFNELNINQDDKIALVGNNTPEWAITFLATVTYGAVIVPILQDFHPDDIINIIEQSESKLLFIEDSYWEFLEKMEISSLRAVFSLSDFRCMRQAHGETLHLIVRQLSALFKERYPLGVQRENVRYTEKDDQKMCLISYTSGTTGFSKGVMLKGDNICCIFECAIKNKLGQPGDHLLAYLPMAHAFGFIFNLMEPIIVGGHLYYMGRIEAPQSIMHAFIEVKPHWITMVPMIMELIYKKNILPILRERPYSIISKIPFLRNLLYHKIRDSIYDSLGGRFKRIFFGGAPLNPDVEKLLSLCKIPYDVGYGMTECASVISSDYHDFTSYSCGRAIDGIEIKIDSQNPLKYSGEILVKGRNVMMGYYRNEEATNQVFTSDGWLKTGDIGMFDKKGNLYVKGRCKSMILTSSGQNVYPEEIETKLCNSPYIIECLVIQRGEKIVALVVPNYDLISKSENVDLIIADQVKRVNHQLPLYANIHSYEIVTSFEKTPKKSIKRYLYN